MTIKIPVIRLSRWFLIVGSIFATAPQMKQGAVLVIVLLDRGHVGVLPDGLGAVHVSRLTHQCAPWSFCWYTIGFFGFFSFRWPFSWYARVNLVSNLSFANAQPVFLSWRGAFSEQFFFPVGQRFKFTRRLPHNSWYRLSALQSVSSPSSSIKVILYQNHWTYRVSVLSLQFVLIESISTSWMFGALSTDICCWVFLWLIS